MENRQPPCFSPSYPETKENYIRNSQLFQPHPPTSLVVDDDETPSTGFTYIETTVIIETHSRSPQTEDSPEVDQELTDKPDSNSANVTASFPNGQSRINQGKIKKKEKLRPKANFSDKSIAHLKSSPVSEEKLFRPRTHRLASFQKPNDGTNLLNNPIVARRAFSLEEKLNTLTSEDIKEKLRLLSSEFSKRTSRKKAKIRKPLTPTSDLSVTSEEETSEVQLQQRLREFFPTPTNESKVNIFRLIGGSDDWLTKLQHGKRLCTKCVTFGFVLDSQSRIYLGWLMLMSICFLYNIWVIPLRTIFRCQSPANAHQWFIADSVADVFYILDTFFLQSHIILVNNDAAIKDPKEIRASYFKSLRFKIGLLSLVPVDIFFVLFRENTPWLRLFRIFKMDCFTEMFLKFDSALSSPHPIRITRSILYMLYLIHMYACAYYALSTWEINAGYQTDWIFDDSSLNSFESYIRCFYFATKTATSIGKNPKPENEIEYLFMTCAWLSGVFAFAILIGQIRDIIATATRNQTEYRQLLYAAVSYLHRFDVPNDLQERVKLWFTYTWQHQRTLDEKNILSLLPQKMQTDIAINVHIEMLNKVKLFHHCEVAFLRDLVPRFHSVIFLPGDYVCRKGEVGKEMYIVKTGTVNVIGGPPGKETILASLGGGSIFGEIALLQVDGMDKRTADVRSAGFSHLFVLTKRVLAEVIKDYPAAQESLRKQAKKLIKRSQKRRKAEKSEAKQKARRVGLNKPSLSSESDSADSVDVIIQESKPALPKMIETVLQLVSSDSKTARYLQYGTKQASTSPDLISSYPPSPYIPAESSGFGGNSDISLSSLESLSP